MKSILTDLLNGFSFNEIPIYLFKIFCALAIAFILKLIFNKKNSEPSDLAKYFILIAAVISAITPFIIYSIPLSVGFLGVFILLSKVKISLAETIYLFLISSLSFGIGSGYVLLTFLLFIIVVTLLILIPKLEE